MIPTAALSELVRQQYERFPYPDYHPEFDKPQLLVSGHLELMSKVLWAGKKSTRGLRVLDAGCGTGSPLVAMATHFPEADIVAVDFSEASLKKARLLAEQYQCKNIRFFNLPIQQLPQLGLTFDFVSASGVLHHLPDPAAGLAAIGQVLDPQGAVSIMLYGKYGRTGIYMIQEALKKMAQNQGETELTPERIRFAYQLSNHLPPHHPLSSRGRGREMQEGKDAGIVDLLLHANDIPFDVPAIYKLCRDAGMSFYRWLFPLIYNVKNFFHDPLLLSQMQHMGKTAQQREEIAELAHGRNSKHSFFAVKPEFQPFVTSFKNGRWRSLHAKLTPCLAWNRTAPIPGKKDMFVIPFTIIQDAWGPMEITRWQLDFLGRITPELTLEEVIQLPQVQKDIPFSGEHELNQEVECLLEKAVERMALVFLDKSAV